MAHLFLSDGGPEAADYSNNYFEFNELNPQVYDLLFQALNNQNHADPEVRGLVESICKLSYSDNQNFNVSIVRFKEWKRNVSKKLSGFFTFRFKPEFI